MSIQTSLLQYYVHVEKKKARQEHLDKTQSDTLLIPEDEQDLVNDAFLRIPDDTNQAANHSDHSEMVINQVHIPTPAERARHLYPEWVANPTFLGPDGLSVFINEEGESYAEYVNP
ncbi:hypothetical protein BLNAU_5084 [Blattamonas nauphoetae]|uniref:Uncharacterized protein n=1 Tax=Blattamonas nauphoetae TaxID=2049346 RepID=A0ABQ9Y827_9EUKA|nr:hypothetical protein BLNAU_5084 [Blattamonas nauphoetae]